MPKKVLIIDDSTTVRQLVCSVLTDAGFNVEEAVDGAAGAERIARVADLALVICDINMPTMNGLEMLEVINADPKYQALPIVMLTTEGQPEMIQRAKAAGAKAWIIKPFKSDLLVRTVKKLTAA